MKYLKTLIISGLAMIAAGTVRSSSGTDSVIASGSPADYFPQRKDLLRDVDFYKDPKVVFPQAIVQATPVLSDGVAPASYDLKMAFVVERNGRVKDARIVRSSGQAALDDAHLKAIKKWRFQPMVYQGKKVPCASLQTYSVETKKWTEEKTAEPGATDNPGDAQ